MPAASTAPDRAGEPQIRRSGLAGIQSESCSLRAGGAGRETGRTSEPRIRAADVAILARLHEKSAQCSGRHSLLYNAG
jgi:hypothetical protein